MNYVNTLIFDGRKNTDFAFFHFRKLKYWLPDKIKGTAQPCGSWMFNFGRGGEIRTHGLLYPNHAWFLRPLYSQFADFIFNESQTSKKWKLLVKKAGRNVEGCQEAKYTFSFGSLPVVCQQEVGDMDDVDAIVITEGQRIPADNVFMIMIFDIY